MALTELHHKKKIQEMHGSDRAYTLVLCLHCRCMATGVHAACLCVCVCLCARATYVNYAHACCHTHELGMSRVCGCLHLMQTVAHKDGHPNYFAMLELIKLASSSLTSTQSWPWWQCGASEYAMVRALQTSQHDTQAVVAGMLCCLCCAVHPDGRHHARTAPFDECMCGTVVAHVRTDLARVLKRMTAYYITLWFTQYNSMMPLPNC